MAIMLLQFWVRRERQGNGDSAGSSAIEMRLRKKRIVVSPNALPTTCKRMPWHQQIAGTGRQIPVANMLMCTLMLHRLHLIW